MTGAPGSSSLTAAHIRLRYRSIRLAPSHLATELGISFPTEAALRASCGKRYRTNDTCTPADQVPAIALGAKEVAPIDMAAAYAAFEESDKGSIEVGKLADFTVLSNDIMKIPPAEILKTTCEMTVIGGEPDRGGAAKSTG